MGTRKRADPRPRHRAAHGLPDGPGPGFDPQYAMGTDLDEPVIIATLTSPAGEAAVPLLIDGYALTDTVH